MLEQKADIGAFSSTVEGQQAIAALSRRLQRRRVAEILPQVAELAKSTPIYIYNVGPRPFVQFMGDLGRFVIQPCLKTGDKIPDDYKGKVGEYSHPLILPGIMTVQCPESESSNKVMMDDGWQVAEGILGIARHMGKDADITMWGVFASRECPPSKADVQAAKLKLQKTYLRLVEEANQAYALGPEQWRNVRQDMHFQAAHALHKTVAECPFLANTVEAIGASKQPCPFCGFGIDPALPKCSNCKEVVNQEAYEAAMAKMRRK